MNLKHVSTFWKMPTRVAVPISPFFLIPSQRLGLRQPSTAFDCRIACQGGRGLPQSRTVRRIERFRAKRNRVLFGVANRSFALALVLSATSALAGWFKVGPDYQRPTSSVPEHYKAETPGA
jgi:hypothetical protein